MGRRRPLPLREILRWADAHREITGRWPTRASGAIPGALGESWSQVDTALRDGLRGLPGGSSLVDLLADRRGKRNSHDLLPLSEKQVLHWADAHFRASGRWPTADSGAIPDSGGERWAWLDAALRKGLRGLPEKSSLARLLARRRGVRNRKDLPTLSTDQILAWADAHHAATGAWPTRSSGPVRDAPGETWMAVAMALQLGRRGMPGGSSLARLLADQRGVTADNARPPLSVEQILAWIDAFREGTGRWPMLDSGDVFGATGETWQSIDRALRRGLRGLGGGSSLARLLAERRGVRNSSSLPRLSRVAILAWADAHRRRTGDWPTKQSGPIPEASGDTWATIDAALVEGARGLRGGPGSVARLLARHRGRRHPLEPPRLTIRAIVSWAEAHYRRTEQWPRCKSGSIPAAPGETWQGVDTALRDGLRGQPGGSSLTRLLARKCGVRNPARLSDLDVDAVLAWADAHQRRTGKWPNADLGPIAEAAGETWRRVDWALRQGKRGLPAGLSLARLLTERRSVPNKRDLPPLTADHIRAWAESHCQRTGKWPTKGSGPVMEAAGETWLGVDGALRYGYRGLAGGSSLAQFLAARS